MIDINVSSFAAAGDPTKYPYTFRREVNTNQQAETFIPFLKAKKWKSAAILAVNNALGTVITPVVEDEAKQAGITITKSVYVNSGTPDVISICASAALPLATWLTQKSATMICVTAAMAALAIYKHKANIQRLLNGTENRLSRKKMPPDSQEPKKSP